MATMRRIRYYLGPAEVVANPAHRVHLGHVGQHANTVAFFEQYEHCSRSSVCGDHQCVPRSQELPSERLAADLRRRIAAGEWGPGEQIPSVTALADSYHVSRATVAKALAALADEGLIVRRHGWGRSWPRLARPGERSDELA